MATVQHAISEHDYISLLDPVGKSKGVDVWPAGTTGTVVSDYGNVKLIEISDDRGVMLDLIQVREPRLKLIAKYSD